MIRLLFNLTAKLRPLRFFIFYTLMTREYFEKLKEMFLVTSYRTWDSSIMSMQLQFPKKECKLLIMACIKEQYRKYYETYLAKCEEGSILEIQYSKIAVDMFLDWCDEFSALYLNLNFMVGGKSLRFYKGDNDNGLGSIADVIETLNS